MAACKSVENMGRSLRTSWKERQRGLDGEYYLAHRPAAGTEPITVVAGGYSGPSSSVLRRSSFSLWGSLFTRRKMLTSTTSSGTTSSGVFPASVSR